MVKDNMKYCGCINCRNRGERNFQEEFELYCSTRELEANAVFEDIFKASYSVGEITDLYNELEALFYINETVDTVKRINEYSMSDNTFNAYEYWRNYGGSLRGFLGP